MTTNFVSYWTHSLGAKVFQDLLDRFSQSLHRMVDIEWQIINLTFFFRYLKGHCHGTNLVAKMGQNCLPTLTYRSVIQKRYGITPCMCKIK